MPIETLVPMAFDPREDPFCRAPEDLLKAIVRGLAVHVLDGVKQAFPIDTNINPESPNDYVRVSYSEEEAGVVLQFIAADENKAGEIGAFAVQRWNEELDAVAAELRQRFPIVVLTP